MLYKDDDVGAGTFSTEWDPGEPATGQAIWPRVAVINDDNVALAASENQQADSLYVNLFIASELAWKEIRSYENLYYYSNV